MSASNQSEWFSVGLAIADLTEENKQLRIMLALAYSGASGLYTDDGEFSDGSTWPNIDFKRMSAATIQDCIRKRSLEQLKALTPEQVDTLLGRHTT